MNDELKNDETKLGLRKWWPRFFDRINTMLHIAYVKYFSGVCKKYLVGIIVRMCR